MKSLRNYLKDFDEDKKLYFDGQNSNFIGYVSFISFQIVAMSINLRRKNHKLCSFSKY